TRREPRRPPQGRRGPRCRLRRTHPVRRRSPQACRKRTWSEPVRNEQVPDRNIAMELVRTTEAAALAAARWMGRGEKNASDAAAVNAMRMMLDTVAMDGVIVIGEGEKDEAPMLYNGERVGTGSGP